MTKWGSAAAKLRRLLTRFGSGWRGIVAVPKEVWGSMPIEMNGINVGMDKMVLGMAASTGQLDALQAIAQAHLEGNLSSAQLDRIIKGLGGSNTPWVRADMRSAFESQGVLSADRAAKFRDVVKDLEAAKQWNHRTGMTAVTMNTEGLARKLNTNSHGFREIIRHERIHSAHYAHIGDPFVKEATGRMSFFEAVKTSSRRIAPWFMKPFNGSDMSTKQTVDMYEGIAGRAADPAAGQMGDLIRDSTEHLAWSNQGNAKFFEQAAKRGWADPRKSAFADLKFAREVKPALEVGWERYATPRNAGIAALVAAGAGVVHHVMKNGRHKHDRKSKQSIRAAAGSTSMPTGA
jgi:hypothetical protein